MLDKCGAKLADALCDNHIIKEENKEIIVYGIDALLSTLINVVIVVGLGLILKLFLPTVVFLISFAVLRVFAGGYHAKTRIGCTASFLTIYLAGMTLQQYTPDIFVKPVTIGLAAISFASVFILAPVEHPNRPYQGNDYQVFKRMSRIIVILQTLLVIAGTFFMGYENLAYCISLAMLGVTIILALAGKIKVRGE